MNHEDSRPARSSLVPLLLVTISLAAILIWQIVLASQQRTGMYEAKRQLAEAIQKREELVKQSNQLQAKLQALVLDLLALGQTDEKARAIVQKYNIQQTTPAAPAAAAALPVPPAAGTP